MNRPTLEFSIIVKKVKTLDHYGLDKKFLEKIDVGDVLVVRVPWNNLVNYGRTGKSMEIINTTKGISKIIKSFGSIDYLFHRIEDYEQVSLL